MTIDSPEILLKKIRFAENLTQEELAARLGYSCRFTVAHVECGSRKASKKFTKRLQEEFPQYFEQEPTPTPAQARLWNPATVEFAVMVLRECGWLEQHDAALKFERLNKPAQNTESPEPWVYMSERKPEQPGRYFVAGYKRNGLPYEGVALLYADGCWYTLRGNRMPTPDKWRGMRHFTETVRY